MDIYISSIRPTFIDHEGFTYLEYEGEFFKGCKRCGGEGHFSHNGEHSRCYTCDDTSAKLGEQFADRAAAEKWCHERAVRRAQADRKRERDMAAKQAKLEAKIASIPEDVRTFLLGVDLNLYPEDEGYERSSFLQTMAQQVQWLSTSERPFTEKMVEGVRKALASRVEKAAEAAAHPAPAGRVAVTGEIVSTKIVEGTYGTAFKILVKDDAGHKVWCTLPSELAREEAAKFYNENGREGIGYGVWFCGSETEPDVYKGVKGRRITFTATLEPSRDDVAFAFGSRPTKGAWL